MMMKAWTVTLRLPAQPEQSYSVQAASNMDAKCEASKQHYGSVYTGQFKYMKAKKESK